LVANPFYGQVQVGPLSQPQVQRAQLLRPFPQFDTLFDEGNPVGHSSYHSFQLQYKHRFGASLVTGAYTLSKSMANTEARLDTGGNSTNAGFLDTYNRGLSRALSAYDVPQRLVVSYSYQLPFGKGKRFLSTAGLMAGVVSGWEVNGIYTAQSGTPLSFSTGTNLTGNLNAVTDVYGTFVSNAVPSNIDRRPGNTVDQMVRHEHLQSARPIHLRHERPHLARRSHSRHEQSRFQHFQEHAFRA
jgi:hypothetical protein